MYKFIKLWLNLIMLEHNIILMHDWNEFHNLAKINSETLLGNLNSENFQKVIK